MIALGTSLILQLHYAEHTMISQSVWNNTLMLNAASVEEARQAV
jgi:hypothetical protein